MATEKYFCFDEQGELKRIKGRLVRFLDNEAPTGSDKSAIRTSLEVSPDAEGLVQADVGTAPNEIPVNGMLGDMAYQSSDSVSVDTLEVTDKIDGSLGIDVTPSASKLEISGTTNSSMMLTRTSSGIVSNLEDASGYGALALYQAGGGVKAYVTGNGNSYFNGGNVGIGGSPSYDLHVTNASTAASIGITGTGGSKDTWTVTSSDTGGKAVLNFRDEDTGTTVLQLHQDNKLVLSSGGGIDFGSTTSGTGNTVTSGLLDDYEEGDWTPSASVGSITGTGLTYVGKYTKIGRLVHIYIRVDATAHDINVASYVGFTGVPFSINTKASGTVIGEDIDVTAQQGFASISGGTLFFGACGNSSAIGLTATLTAYI